MTVKGQWQRAKSITDAEWDQRYEQVFGLCSRCKKRIEGFCPPCGGMTAGYYVAAGWRKYVNPGEVYVCDACMWSDPRYVADYGTHSATGDSTGEP